MSTGSNTISGQQPLITQDQLRDVLDQLDPKTLTTRGPNGSPALFSILPCDMAQLIFDYAIEAKNFNPRKVCRAWRNLFDRAITQRLRNISSGIQGPINFGNFVRGLEKILVEKVPMKNLRFLTNYSLYQVGLPPSGHKETKGIVCTNESDLNLVQTTYSANLVEVWSRLKTELTFATGEKVPVTADEIDAYLKNPDNAAQLQEITALDLSHANVTTIPNIVLSKLPNLVILNLSSTNIIALPRELFSLAHLTSLNFSNTAVQTIPEDISKLRSLESLIARNTQIDEVPPQVTSMNTLRSLEVDNCPKLVKIPSAIRQMKNLTVFTYAGSPIAMGRTYGRCIPKNEFNK